MFSMGIASKKNMLMFLRGFCRCSCLILAAACASASFLPLASPTPRFHANSITSDTKCTFPVRPEYVPSTFRWLPFLDIFCSTELVWSAFLSVLSAALLSINVRPWPGLCPPPCPVSQGPYLSIGPILAHSASMHLPSSRGHT